MTSTAGAAKINPQLGAAGVYALAWGRWLRGLRRQMPTLFFVAPLVTVFGVTLEIIRFQLVSLALLYWVPAGLVASLVIAIAREFNRKTMTFPSSLGKKSGHQVLGVSPELGPHALHSLPPDKRSLLDYLIIDTTSPFAAAFRDLQSAISEDRLVAFIGARPGDGATTVALGAAVCARQQGRSVVVVDCDIRRRGLTEALGVKASQGVLEACENVSDWARFVEEEAETGLHFLPAARSTNPWRTLVGAKGVSDLLHALCRSYDLVVLDCPPVLTIADGAFIARHTERCILVVAWDRTPVRAIRTCMKQLHDRTGAKASDIYVNRILSGYRFAAAMGYGPRAPVQRGRSPPASAAITLNAKQ